MSRRRARLNEQLRRELTDLIRREVRDPRVGIVTITAVEVSGDLSHARVWIREVGGGDEMQRSLEGLTAAAPFLRTALGRMLRVRRVPELHFQEDRSYEGAQRIEQVLSEVLPDDAGLQDDPDPEDGAGADGGGEPPAAGDAEGEDEAAREGAP